MFIYQRVTIIPAITWETLPRPCRRPCVAGAWATPPGMPPPGASPPRLAIFTQFLRSERQGGGPQTKWKGRLNREDDDKTSDPSVFWGYSIFRPKGPRTRALSLAMSRDTTGASEVFKARCSAAAERATETWRLRMAPSEDGLKNILVTPKNNGGQNLGKYHQTTILAVSPPQQQGVIYV